MPSAKRMRAVAFRCRLPASYAIWASAWLEKYGITGFPSSSFSTGTDGSGAEVRWNRPMIMSCDGMATGRPSEGLRMLFVDSMRMRASACASAPSGR
ncbi:Uncharacterised protein [Mycobacteroides abscessus subsp. abscessus]|nr:Uncharacterised protein [Mycobacteroides abscessus subsp. abscessus]